MIPLVVHAVSEAKAFFDANSVHFVLCMGHSKCADHRNKELSYRPIHENHRERCFRIFAIGF